MNPAPPETPARRPVLYPFLLAVFPAVSLYAHNIHETVPRVLFAPLVVSLAVAGVLWGALRLVLRDPHRAGLVTTLLLGLFYSAGRITDGLNFAAAATARTDAGIVPKFLTHEVVGGEVIAVALLITGALRTKSPDAWTAPMNAFAAIGLALPLGGVLTAGLGDPARTAPVPSELEARADPDPKPDIYYLILDGFGRADTLRDLYGVDAGPFLKALRDRGFFVADDASSNYSQTRLSLASSLNGAYLEPLRHTTMAEEDPLRDLIHHSGIARALRSRGYTFLSFDSGYHLTEDIPADETLGASAGLPEFQRILLGQTALSLFPNQVGWQDPFTLARTRVLYTLDHLPEVARRPGPTFTFAHVLCPHPPFIFGPDGEDVANRKRGFSISDGDAYEAQKIDDYVQGYRSQVTFLMKRVAATIDRILAESATPPIIIIQGDHGPGSKLNHGDPDQTDVPERFRILNAYHFPGVTPADIGLTPDMTPVNSFRVLLNAYFGSHLSKLSNRNYYSRFHTPYDFVDVTDRLRPGATKGEGEAEGDDAH